eukprot:CAMPEP_0204320548 /NCGR_PEP_ID=MMETSP0469-20131031/7699_1 /ASSEMBLY_ACC=CAM_ASM_000384 /TAXON_ID=2969 /ORGANISM="Oxyrrhis marina" /LENGTH=342 /DNA_ID=CAMNT_0051301813 /DNA_START=1 /DNA_END=1029 /DNA_ORIENTATION=-
MGIAQSSFGVDIPYCTNAFAECGRDTTLDTDFPECIAVVLPVSGEDAGNEGFYRSTKFGLWQRQEIVVRLHGGRLPPHHPFCRRFGRNFSAGSAQTAMQREGMSKGAEAAAPPKELYFPESDRVTQFAYFYKASVCVNGNEVPDSFLLYLNASPDSRHVEGYERARNDARAAASMCRTFKTMKAQDDPVKISVAFPSMLEIVNSNMTTVLPPGQSALLLSVPDMAAAGGATKFIFDGLGEEKRDDVVDAFFHFAHVNSGFRRMPWDLQGYASPSQGVVLVDPIVWSDSDLTDARCGPVVNCGGSAPDMSSAFRILHPNCNGKCISTKLGGSKGFGDFLACTR